MILTAVAIKLSIDTGIVKLAADSTVNYAAQQEDEKKEFDEMDSFLVDATSKVSGEEVGEGTNGETIQISKAEYESMKQDIQDLKTRVGSIQSLENDMNNLKNSEKYHPGDSITMSNIFCSGTLTTNAREVYFTMSLEKDIGEDVKSIGVSSNFLAVRAEGKYILGSGSYGYNVGDYFTVSSFRWCYYYSSPSSDKCI